MTPTTTLPLLARVDRLGMLAAHVACGVRGCPTCLAIRQALKTLGLLATAVTGLQTEPDCWCPPGWVSGGNDHTHACQAARRAVGVHGGGNGGGR